MAVRPENESKYWKNPASGRATTAKQRERRRTWMGEIAQAAGCADCGYDDHPAALTFEHRNRDEREFPLSRATTFSEERILAEIAKCDVLCFNCLAIRYADTRRPGSRLPGGRR